MKIVCFCTVHTGLAGIKLAINRGVKPSKIIGLNPYSVKDLDTVSGYVDIKDFCSGNGIDYQYADDYTLKTEAPEALYENADIIWVAGWQRLLPDRFIESANLVAIGGHGSCDGILKGRGRSPQNWALLMGKGEFEISLFKIDVGVDSGPTIITDKFTLNDGDTIFHSYLKASLAFGKAMVEVCQNPALIDNAAEQSGTPEYFPKRTTEDGSIDWSMSARDIANQVRALADPYPNARTLFSDQEIRVRSASYIDCGVIGSIGEVIDMLSATKILVQAGDGCVLLEELNSVDAGAAPDIAVGSSFQSIPMSQTVKRIMDRFRKEFGGKALNSSLRNFWTTRGFLD